MINSNIKNWIFFILLVLINCSEDISGNKNSNFFDVKPVEIMDYSPDKEFINNDDVVIKIKFSKQMKRKSVEGAFTFEEDKQKIDGDFKWSNNDSELKFKPEKTCLYGKKYSVTLLKKAEDINGNDLKKDFEHSFQLGKDKVLPYVIQESCTPGANTNLDITQLRQPIVILFSEPMDKSYPYNNLKITPEIEGTYQWYDNNNNPVDQLSSIPSQILVFTPITDYLKQKYYTVEVKDTFTDLNKNKLRNPFSFKFYVCNNFLNPDILSVHTDTSQSVFIEGSINEGIQKNARIIIEFTKEMNKESIEQSGAIKITPDASISKKLIWSNNNQRVTIELDKDVYYKWNTVYRLSIFNTAADIYDNKLTRNYNYDFLINNLNSRPPELINMEVQVVGVTSVLPPFDYGNILDDIENNIYTFTDCIQWSVERTLRFTFRLYFDSAQEIDIFSLFSSCTFTSLGNTETNFTIVDIQKSGMVNGLYCYTIIVDSTGNSQGGIHPDSLILMNIKGENGVQDINKNYMPYNINIYFKFQY